MALDTTAEARPTDESLAAGLCCATSARAVISARVSTAYIAIYAAAIAMAASDGRCGLKSGAAGRRSA